MPQLLHLSNQHQADFNLLQDMVKSFQKTGTLSDNEKVVLGIIIKRMPNSEQKSQAVALYNHLMQTGK